MNFIELSINLEGGGGTHPAGLYADKPLEKMPTQSHLLTFSSSSPSFCKIIDTDINSCMMKVVLLYSLAPLSF